MAKNLYEKKESTVFLAKLQNDVNVREEMGRIFEEVFFAVVDKFNGKVMNKKFWDALENGLREKCTSRIMSGRSCYIRDKKEYYYSQDKTTPKNYICANFVTYPNFCYTDTIQLYFGIALDDPEVGKCYRIDAKATKENAVFAKWLESFGAGTAKRQIVVDNYDKYICIAEKAKQAIDELNRTPVYFRDNICKCPSLYICVADY